MTLIETKTVGSGGAANIDFTSIPATYTDLYLVMSIRNNDSTRNVGWVNIQFNNSTSNRSWRDVYGNGSNVFSSSDTTMRIGSAQGDLATADTFGSASLYIPNYLSANFKSSSGDGVAERNNTTTNAGLDANLWSDTAAITSIKLVPGDGTGWVQHSTASLYGISRVTSTPKATGGIVSQDATHWYHTFPFTSTFTPTAAISADILCVAGGGGGGGQNPGGGGGAGGLRAIASQSLTTTAYTITVGAGGAGGIPNDGTQGGNSSIAGSGFTTFAASGGGYGMAFQNPGVAGGSGSGASGWRSSTTQSGGAGNIGSYSPVEGFAGGSFTNNGGGTNFFVASGGGGAGGVGGSTVSNTNISGDGGVGTNTYNSINFSSWLNVTFTGVNGKLAGGGAGGIDGTTPGTAVDGGGDGGGTASVAKRGITNTGGGGGGGFPGAAGGSGLVIIRYAK
jgi:hypothetical protein